MTTCDIVVYLETVVILAWVVFLAVYFFVLRKRKKKESNGNEARNAHQTFPDIEKHVEQRADQLKSLQEELRQERKDRENALKRFSDIEKHVEQRADQLKSLQEELRQERKDRENALKRLSEMERSFGHQTEQIKSLQDELRHERAKITTLSVELQNEKEEKANALKRLSAIMSSRLRDGNPNVVDLSDQNRPLKIGEQFSELYDNQWTDAYSAVENYFKKKMEGPYIIKLLLDILEQCFIFCKKQETRQMVNIRDSVQTIVTTITKKTTKLPEYLMQRLKEERKLLALNELPEYSKVSSYVKAYFLQEQIETDFLDVSELEMFVKECLKLFWLMVVQDPPMAMLLQPVGNANDVYKAYAHRGIHLAFVVWPALLLEEGGAVLMKGVAEFRE